MVIGLLNLEMINKITLEFALKHNLFVELRSYLNEDLSKCGAQISEWRMIAPQKFSDPRSLKLSGLRMHSLWKKQPSPSICPDLYQLVKGSVDAPNESRTLEFPSRPVNQPKARRRVPTCSDRGNDIPR
jgi:hypothetical protein